MERSVTRHAIRLAQPRPTSSPLHRVRNPLLQQFLRNRSNNNKTDDQAYPLTGYYADILTSRQTLSSSLNSTPTNEIQPQTQTPPTPPPTTTSLPKTDKEETIQKARIVFGSRLAGPGERKDEIEKASKEVAGVRVPPKPTEPDNCCMSGCVNCVWDIYREEFEEWVAKSAEAREKIEVQQRAEKPDAFVASSVDDDGGGSEGLWMEGSAKAEGEEEEKDPFADVPVGIREFMRTEKMLKQKHAAQGSKGG